LVNLQTRDSKPRIPKHPVGIFRDIPSTRAGATRCAVVGASPRAAEIDIKDDIVVVKVVGNVAAGTWQIGHGRAPVRCGGCSAFDIRGDTIGIEIPNTNP